MNRLPLRPDHQPRKRQADACVGFGSTNDLFFAPSTAYARPEGADAMVPEDGSA